MSASIDVGSSASMEAESGDNMLGPIGEGDGGMLSKSSFETFRCGKVGVTGVTGESASWLLFVSAWEVVSASVE